MPIADLQVRQGKVDLVLTIVEKGDVREFEKFGKTGRVCNATAKDDSGQISLTLWNDDIDKVGVGDKVHIINGYVSEWQGEKQLSTGKFGTLEILEKGSDETSAEDKKEAEEFGQKAEEAAEEDIITEEETIE